MKRIFIYTILAAGALLASSCEDRLNIDQHSVSSIDNYFQNDAEAEEGIVTCYGKMRTLNTSIGSINRFMDFLSDDIWCGGGSHYDGDYHMISDYTFGSDYSTISTLYSNLYSLVYSSNVVMEKVSGTSEVMKRAVAEAKVFRAYAYFYLTTLWGTPPIVDHTLAESDYFQTNASKEDLWALIEKDLKEAIESNALVKKSSVTDYTSRISHHFAMALLGKAYLFQGKNAEAAAMLDAVIDSNLYELEADLSNVGTPLGVCSKESLFEVNMINDRNVSNNNDFGWTFTGLRGEKYTYDSNEDGTSTSVFCSSTFGFINPRKELYDDFVSIEGVDGYRLNNTIKTIAQMSSEYDTKNIMEITDNEGYYNFKYRVLSSIWAGYFYANNIRVMKFNEVLLLAAEANININPAKSLKYMTMIRERAQAPVPTSVTMDDIKKESRVELCFEGHRYENLIRWGDAAAELGANGQSNPALQVDGSVTWTSYNEASKCGFKTGKHELLPFPAAEMSVNSNMNQNPGW